MTGAELAGRVDVTDAAIRGMVHEVTAGWRVVSVDRFRAGTDVAAALAVRTPVGRRRVVCKAVTGDDLDAAVARAEPRLLELVGSETSVPVPEVLAVCDAHPEHPSPFFLAAYVDGVDLPDGREAVEELSPPGRESVLRAAGEHLAELHELGPLPGSGPVGVREGELAVLDPEQCVDSRDWVLEGAAGALDRLLDGGYFPALADEPARFADLVPDLREHLRATLPELPEPDPATYCHTDYRYGNLILDPASGRPAAVLDWGLPAAVEPAYNLALAESLLLFPAFDGPERTAELRELLRDGYAAAREDWTFDAARRERLRAYRLVCRLHAMACLPLWVEERDARDERAAEHRAVVREYL